MSDQATGGPSHVPSTAVPDWLTEQPWRRSSFCGAGNCIEVAMSAGTVLVRDSKRVSNGFVKVERDVWETTTPNLLEGVGSVSLDGVIFRFDDEGGLTVEEAEVGISLSFDAEETTAFLRGLKAGEYRSVAAS